jgi:Ni,Fe-hydrogenase III large subunit
MEALIADIDADMKLIRKELDGIKRKLLRLKTETDHENIDSHTKAVAASLHSIYSGYENILERIIRAIDGDTPLGTQYHVMLLKRAMNVIDGVRPAILAAETFRLLDELRTYRHKFRNIYLYLLSTGRIVDLAQIGIKSFELFERDINTFKGFLLSKP